MKKILVVLVAGMMAGVFFYEVPSAHAIFGIRAARTALAARKAKQTLAEDPNDEATERANENLRRLERESQTRNS
ncbi:MAG: hypothetical protein WC133_01435 [Candidatus Omnitrophota bacterium]